MTHAQKTLSPSRLILLSLAALGIVFGDIGTSPLYALKECFHGPHAIALNSINIFGVLSLITWSLIIVISIKYIVYVMRADNRGEGGVLALMVLAMDRRRQSRAASTGLLLAGLFGSALIFGDGMITPAISVVSAVEGLSVATSVFSNYIAPITCIILAILFFNQKHGTGKIGYLFGPFILIWFSVIGALGLWSIQQSPTILHALNPIYAFKFFAHNGIHGILILGTIFLVVTGGEALYADMGHFGRQPIRLAWFSVALPGLLLNYFGQGALLLRDPSAVTHPFFKLVPVSMLYPMVGLATIASVVASQALISGVFSLTRQAIQLGYFPRFSIYHTSSREVGQIYIPVINALLFIATVALVLAFPTSSALAAAYGVAVTMTMAITTILMFFVIKRRWHVPVAIAGTITAILLTIDIAFLIPNLAKISHGGWVPLVIGGIITIIMTTWYKGRNILAARLAEKTDSLKLFIQSISENPPHRVPGVAVYMTRDPWGTPAILSHNFRHNQILHQSLCLLMVETEDIPIVPPSERADVTPLGGGFYRIAIRYGFTETPDIPAALSAIRLDDGPINLDKVTYFLGREILLPTSRAGMAIWREHLFAFLSKNAQRATTFFNIPSDKVIEIGIQVEL
ncbi:potassium transporter Kup [bacterium]|nr:potassium transporter Kup [bacterium]